MVQDCLKLTTYFAERDRGSGRFVAEELLDVYARERVLASAVLRGIEGFGLHHGLQTERLLTLSEDLPLVTVAVDTRERIERLLPEALDACPRGLVTLEHAKMVAGRFGEVQLDTAPDEALKVTVLVGRGERAGGRLASHAVVDVMRRRGLHGATAFLGVDGTAHGERRRAGFFGRNAGVPVAVVGIGAAGAVTAAVADLAGLLDRPLLLIEKVRVCKAAGERLAPPEELPEADASALPVWQKLMVHAPEAASHDGAALYAALIRRLREAGAAGATALRGFWGYQGTNEPRGDGLLSPRRRVPVVVTVLDTPERARRWLDIVDEVTSGSGLVTSEYVPVVR